MDNRNFSTTDFDIQRFADNLTIFNNNGDYSLVKGGDGNDSIKGYRNDYVTVEAGDGNDTIVGTFDFSKIYGEDGNDYISIVGSTGTNTIFGGDGSDTVVAYGDVVIEGGDGDDVINLVRTTSARSTISGGKGNDSVSGYNGGGSSFIFQYSAGDGDDIIYRFSSVTDTISIGGSDDWSITDSGNDRKITIGDGSIIVYGKKGQYINVIGTGGSRYIENDESHVTIGGGSDTDTDTDTTADTSTTVVEETLPDGLTYNSGRTVITAKTQFTGSVIDTTKYASTVTKVNATSLTRPVEIIGNDNDNSLKGGKSDDTLRGGAGNNTLTGGTGNDVFVLSGDNNIITDYKEGQDIIVFDVDDTISSDLASSSDIPRNSDTADPTFSFTWDIIRSDIVFSNGTTIKSGKNKLITFMDSNNETVRGIFDYNGNFYREPQTGLRYNSNKTMLSTTDDFAEHSIDLKDYAASVVNFNAIGSYYNIDIIGGDSNNQLKGGSGDDTLRGEAGNDTLTGGKGADIFVHSSGDDVINDFKSGEDKIQLDGCTITSNLLQGTNVILTTSDSSGNVGTVTIKKVKNKPITIIDSDGNETSMIYADGGISYSLPAGFTYDKTFKKLTAPAAFDSNGIDLANFLSTVTKVDASKAKTAVQIIGNDNDNSLKGGNGDDTLAGGNGDDTLRGGEGSDTFIHSSGNDVIADYDENFDNIVLANGLTVTDVSIKSSDIILFTSGETSITIKRGKDKQLTLTDGNGNTTSQVYGRITYNSTRTTAYIEPQFKGTLRNTDYDSTVVTIDATQGQKKLSIYGNDNANEILGTSKADTIYGGAGADTLTGGKGNDLLFGGEGNDVFVYTKGDGKDIIMDYSAGDVIQLGNANTSVSSVTYSDNDIVLKFRGGGSVTVRNAGDSDITVLDVDGNDALPSDSPMLASSAMLIADDNFITNSVQLDDIMDVGNVGQVNFSTNYDLTPSNEFDVTLYEASANTQ